MMAGCYSMDGHARAANSYEHAEREVEEDEKRHIELEWAANEHQFSYAFTLKYN